MQTNRNNFNAPLSHASATAKQRYVVRGSTNTDEYRPGVIEDEMI